MKTAAFPFLLIAGGALHGVLEADQPRVRAAVVAARCGELVGERRLQLLGLLLLGLRLLLEGLELLLLRLELGALDLEL